MNVSMSPHRFSRAIERIETALYTHAPASIVWTDYKNADLVIFPITGRKDHVEVLTNQLRKEGRKYAVIQLSLKSTRNQNPADWMTIWRNATVVWSYYYLSGNFNFYHSSLGADPKKFHRLGIDKQYIAGTTGNYTRAECLFEVHRAAHLVQKASIRINADNDQELNRQYNLCSYISGLRTKEGFELPAAEGMLAGARPILFDTPDFRYWYDGIAEFIPVGDIDQTIGNLTVLFQNIPTITPMEISYAAFRFDWKRIIGGFWERAL